jgi:calmodulin|mmetsp:Transcript_27993/g.47414  ORF Transcript_27993/g.47414 Transcript_27993/m.47414 type:complete len:186 (-) Transcript_27993:1189-1746(-)|eukprot:CAMPEP_0174301294 /NCGR_PEP_ID=MMETSP0809-20121228/58968_1 /TAXON_ID=73025 ORGANISM="Eutreptiella gymnastica-like, Strain CCMP1594" /NCGR_SAMPLE_ID=MMETSP0809 /ASSEMBLY_ACC=CAM_ASM_000658 /LENGTH=185 /DNA_ID=CAMNT_0015407025 /DNA_START=70 /DNA_END=627 /DNA_ORIENTATION=+
MDAPENAPAADVPNTEQAAPEGTVEDRSMSLGAELGLTDLEISRFKEAFTSFDRDGDGTVTVAELHLAIKRAGQDTTEEAVQEMIAEVDKDQSGEVCFKEFCQMMMKVQKATTDPSTEVQEGFKVFDKDGSGTVSIEEIKHVLTQVGEHLDEEHWQVMEQMLREVDGDGDGEITYPEFLQMIAVE